MFLNSKTLRCDVSDVRTCEVCTEKPIFFSDKDFYGHFQKCHSKKRTGQDAVAAQGLQELERSKQRLTKQLENIKMEYRQLYKNGMAKKRTVEIIQKEISSLTMKISRNEEEITRIKSSLLKKEEKFVRERVLNHPQQFVAAFKQKMDKEYACLYDSLTPKIGAPTILSEDGDTESLRSEASNDAFQRLTNERLSTLEAAVKQMKEHASDKEKQKATDGQSFQEVTRKCQTLEDQMESKTKELED